MASPGRYPEPRERGNPPGRTEGRQAERASRSAERVIAVTSSGTGGVVATLYRASSTTEPSTNSEDRPSGSSQMPTSSRKPGRPYVLLSTNRRKVRPAISSPRDQP